MPTSTPTSPSRVCILILTYKRNDALLRLISQCREIIDTYRGHNIYELCVTDSDPNNPIAPLPPHLNVRYSINPGSGFDDNLYFFWCNNVDKYDFIFSIGDDDMFAPWLNPLYLLDAAIDTGNQVALFNNRNFKWLSSSNFDLGHVDFPEIGLIFDKALLLQRVLKVLPSHVGILYSTKLLKITLKKASEFRGTLHLYAVPVIFAAAANTLFFSEYVLCLYHNDGVTDGAWSASDHVMNGLVDFLKKLKQLLPPDLYSVAEAGYFHFYFGPNSWLRQKLRHNPSLKSEQQIRMILASTK